MEHTYNLEELNEMYKNFSQDTLIYVNVLGEPFFKNESEIYKVSPETGDKETVDSSIDDDYWTCNLLKENWEFRHGKVGNQHFLLPIIPFSLGGEFEIKNLMMLDIQSALRYYDNIRKQIKRLPDGATINFQIKED